MRILAFALLSITIVFPCICHADSGAPACDTRVYREHALAGDWVQALKVSDSCIAESDVKLKQKQPDLAKDPWSALVVANAAEWRRVSAELHALSGDFTAAESGRAEAESLFVSFIPPAPGGMLTEVDTRSDAATKAFILELQGHPADAIHVYDALSLPSRDVPRLGVLLVKTGDWGGAAAWARYRDTSSHHADATALYVLGLIAEHQGDAAAAAGAYRDAEQALQKTLVYYAGTPSYDYADAPAIRAGLERATKAMSGGSH